MDCSVVEDERIALSERCNNCCVLGVETKPRGEDSDDRVIGAFQSYRLTECVRASSEVEFPRDGD